MKRRAFKLVVLLLLGAIVNVAVAWGCAIWSSLKVVTPVRTIQSLRAPVWWTNEYDEWFAAGRGDIVGCEVSGFGRGGFVYNADAIAWLRLKHGWPLLAIEHGLESETRGRLKAFCALALQGHTANGDPKYRFVPLRPIWPGFAINTLFYAGILWGGWLMLAAPLALRRRRRIRRGVCPACGYDLRGRAADSEANLCPECGASANTFSAPMRRLGLFVLAGAIVNIAVAWGCGAFAYPRSGSQQFAMLDSHLVAWRTCAGYTMVNWMVYPPYSGAKHAPPSYVKLRNDGRTFSELFAGWPMRSLMCSKPRDIRIFIGNGTFMGHIFGPVEYGVKLPERENGLFQGWRALPCLPVWPGFAINTLFYAGILWMVFAAPFALRRRRRIKRGVCPACAYPVGASDVCTECGKPVRTK